MNLIPNKRGLYHYGHLIFSLSLAIIFILLTKAYIIKDFQIPTLLLISHCPFYIAGAFFQDFVEPGGQGRIGHRRFFHSKRMVWINLFILIPLFYKLATDNPFKTIYIFEYNYYSLALAFCLGSLSHLTGDALTSKLKY